MEPLIKEKKNRKRGLITKTWERCKSLGRGTTSAKQGQPVKRSKSWPSPSGKKHRNKDRQGGRVAPEGCFSVYVGPEKQRFVIRTEYANHPLFRALLEEAETEFGYSCTGPLELPCWVDEFIGVLMEMAESDSGGRGPAIRGCGFGGGCGGQGAYRLLSPSRMMAIN